MTRCHDSYQPLIRQDIYFLLEGIHLRDGEYCVDVAIVPLHRLHQLSRSIVVGGVEPKAVGYGCWRTLSQTEKGGEEKIIRSGSHTSHNVNSGNKSHT